MSFLRLTRWHTLAAVAALALMLFLALDWSTTDLGEVVRRDQELIGEPANPSSESAARQQELNQDADIAAEQEERNAWQAIDFLDHVVLLALLAAVALALAMAAARAAGRRPSAGISLSIVTAVAGAAGALLVMVWIIREGAVVVGGQVELGAPLSLVAAGLIGIGAARAARVERAEAGAAEPSPDAGVQPTGRDVAGAS